MRIYLPIEPTYRDTQTTNSVSGVVISKLSATDSRSVTGSVRALQDPLLPTSVQIGYSRTGTSELRERIRASGVRIRIKDRRARSELEVVPREFTGRPLRGIEPIQAPEGTIEAEIYLHEPSADNCVALFRHGTRVVPDICRLPGLDREPWTSGLLQGLVEAPFLQLTPGTRDGVVLDACFEALRTGLQQIEPAIIEQIERERAAAEEEASRSILRSVRKALTEGFQSLPREDYTMLEVPEPRRTRTAGAGSDESAGNGHGELPLITDDPPQAVEPGVDGTDQRCRPAGAHAAPVLRARRPAAQGDRLPCLLGGEGRRVMHHPLHSQGP